MALVLAFAIVATPTLALADELGGEGFALQQRADDLRYNAGTGAVAALSSLVYGPLKMAFALTSMVAGGVAYLFTVGDEATARKVAGPGFAGDYVITRHHITGDRDLEFFGQGPF